MAIDRRDFVKGAAAGAAILPMMARGGSERPNILWLVSEDNSPWLGCYGEPLARTPNLDKMAAEGTRFTRAFVNCPVCAPSRSTLHTGMYASSLGSLHMRSRVPLPSSVQFFTNHLRAAGYRCINGAKTDYNTPKIPDGAWDERRMTPSFQGLGREPFFMFVNYMTTHESCLHKSRDVITDPARVILAPHHPDTPVIRHDYAQYHDSIAKLDTQIGQILGQLEAAGLAENTIVFYFSDNAGILPWSKRFLHDRGTWIPMIASVPERYRALTSLTPGQTFDEFVSFVDIAPTMLSLAGVPIPEYMQGRAFLGPAKAPPPEFVYGLRGRMDERYDVSRSVRDRYTLYIANYMPHYPWGRHLDYLWKMPAMQSWDEEYKAGRCNETQSRFFHEKPFEELYDLANDPHQTRNLAADQKYSKDIARLREVNREFLKNIRDVCLLPEAEMHRRGKGGSPRDMQDFDVERVLNAAEQCAARDADNVAGLISLLEDRDSGVRYWSATGCAALGERSRDAGAALRKALQDESPSVRVAAADAMQRLGETQAAIKTLRGVLRGPDVWAGLEAADAVFNLGEKAGESIKSLAHRAANKATRVSTLGALF